MGRNGKNAPVFQSVIRVINLKETGIISADDVLLGQGLGRNAVTSYLYKLVKLGYLKPINDGLVKDQNTKYEIVRTFPRGFTSVQLKQEMDKLNAANKY